MLPTYENFEQQRRRQFLFDGQIELFGIPGLIVRIDADDAAAGIVGKRQIERRNRGKAVADALRDELGAGVEAVDRPERHVAVQPQRGAAVPGRVPEEARSAAHDGVLRRLVRKAKTRREGLLEGLDARGSAHAVAARDEDRCGRSDRSWPTSCRLR